MPASTRLRPFQIGGALNLADADRQILIEAGGRPLQCEQESGPSKTYTLLPDRFFLSKMPKPFADGLHAALDTCPRWYRRGHDDSAYVSYRVSFGVTA